MASRWCAGNVHVGILIVSAGFGVRQHGDVGVFFRGSQFDKYFAY